MWPCRTLVFVFAAHTHTSQSNGCTKFVELCFTLTPKFSLSPQGHARDEGVEVSLLGPTPIQQELQQFDPGRARDISTSEFCLRLLYWGFVKTPVLSITASWQVGFWEHDIEASKMQGSLKKTQGRAQDIPHGAKPTCAQERARAKRKGSYHTKIIKEFLPTP